MFFSCGVVELSSKRLSFGSHHGPCSPGQLDFQRLHIRRSLLLCGPAMARRNWENQNGHETASHTEPFFSHLLGHKSSIIDSLKKKRLKMISIDFPLPPEATKVPFPPTIVDQGAPRLAAALRTWPCTPSTSQHGGSLPAIHKKFGSCVYPRNH